MDLTSTPPVLADLYFAKIWLARRFTAPGCEPVCCDGNGAFPFARGAFAYAMCSDAFMFIWTKRLFVGEMSRLVDGHEPGHRRHHAHPQSADVESVARSAADAGGLPAPVRDRRARIFGEAGLFADVVGGGPLDLSRVDREEALNSRPGADHHRDASRRACSAGTASAPPAAPRGVYRVNPLYVRPPTATASICGCSFRIRRLRGRVRRLPRLPAGGHHASSSRRSERLEAGGPLDELIDLIRRRVIVDLPRGLLLTGFGSLFSAAQSPGPSPQPQLLVLRYPT